MAALVLAVPTYMFIAFIVNGIFFFLDKDWATLPGVVPFVGACLGAFFGIYGAEEACNTIVRVYSGKLVCAFFVIVNAITLINVLVHWQGVHWHDFGWVWLTQIAQALVAALLAIPVFWSKSDAAFERGKVAA